MHRIHLVKSLRRVRDESLNDEWTLNELLIQSSDHQIIDGLILQLLFLNKRTEWRTSLRSTLWKVWTASCLLAVQSFTVQSAEHDRNASWSNGEHVMRYTGLKNVIMHCIHLFIRREREAYEWVSGTVQPSCITFHCVPIRSPILKIDALITHPVCPA